MMNNTTRPARSGKPRRRAANSKPTRHGKYSVTAAVLFASLSGQAHAAPNCSAYIPTINKALASYPNDEATKYDHQGKACIASRHGAEDATRQCDLQGRQIQPPSQPGSEVLSEVSPLAIHLHKRKIMNAKATKPNSDTAQTTPAAESDAGVTYWLLKEGKCRKLGKNAEGGITYQVLADADRQRLYIAITGNESGGYFSRERVPIDKIEACLNALPPDKPFPSKALKDTFVGRSSNNSGFAMAVLRNEGLATAAPDAETQHVRHGDMATWRVKLLTEPGKQITLPDQTNRTPVGDGGPDEATGTTLSLPRKKAQ